MTKKAAKDNLRDEGNRTHYSYKGSKGSASRRCNRTIDTEEGILHVNARKSVHTTRSCTEKWGIMIGYIRCGGNCVDGESPVAWGSSSRGTAKMRRVRRRYTWAKHVHATSWWIYLVVGGQEAFGAHDPQFNESALEGWGGYTPDENAERDRDETESQCDTPLPGGNTGDLEGRTTNKHDKDLSGDFCKWPSLLKHFST